MHHPTPPSMNHSMLQWPNQLINEWPTRSAPNDSPALSMVGKRRLDHVHALLDDVVLRGVPGDFAECGCWRGGVAALAAAVLKSAGQLRQSQNASSSSSSSSSAFSSSSSSWPPSSSSFPPLLKHSGSRSVWLFDSFKGLPPPDVSRFPDDEAHIAEAKYSNDAVLKVGDSNGGHGEGHGSRADGGGGGGGAGGAGRGCFSF